MDGRCRDEVWGHTRGFVGDGGYRHTGLSRMTYRSVGIPSAWYTATSTPTCASFVLERNTWKLSLSLPLPLSLWIQNLRWTVAREGYLSRGRRGTSQSVARQLRSGFIYEINSDEYGVVRVRRERNYLHGDENIRLVRVMFEFEIARNLLVNWTGNKSVDFIQFRDELYLYLSGGDQPIWMI